MAGVGGADGGDVAGMAGGGEPVADCGADRAAFPLAFDLRRVLCTDYKTDSFQKSYFVMPSLEDVLRVIEREDVLALCRELEGVPDVDPGTVGAEDLLAA